jgi:periplasmic divalent cation tolerance protein
MEAARIAARQLVDEQVVACGNIVPAIESIYRWQGKVETSAEVLVIFKTTAAMYPKLEARIRELHSYEVPEIIAFRTTEGLPAYLKWVAESCQ